MPNLVNRFTFTATGTVNGDPVSLAVAYDPVDEVGILEIPGLEELQIDRATLKRIALFLALERGVMR